jgi:hypothetical protein
MWHSGRDEPPWRTAAGSWRRASWPCGQRCSPAAVGYDGSDSTSWGMAAGMLTPYDTATGCTTADVYFSKIFIRPFIFRKSKKKYIKKFRAHGWRAHGWREPCRSWLWALTKATKSTSGPRTHAAGGAPAAFRVVRT